MRLPTKSHLFLLRELVSRDFAGRYAGSTLGLVWSFLLPAWQLLLFSFVFSTVLRISPIGERTDRFWIFLFCGLLPWLAIHEAILRGSTAITENAPLVKKLRFPSELLVVTVVLAALLHQAIATGVFVVALAVVGELHWRSLPWLLVALPLQVALTSGLALLLAALQVFLRDLAQLLGMLLSAWFYLTPVVYPLGLVPQPFRQWVLLNPLTGLVALYRRAFLGAAGPTPGLTTLAIAAAVSLALGWWVFRRLRAGFGDQV